VRKKPDDWGNLRKLIAGYVEAAIADSWKGGGDPADIDVKEAMLELTRAKLEAHITKMQRGME